MLSRKSFLHAESFSLFCFQCSNQDHLFSDLADPRTRYKRCAQCSIPCYCSRECQKADWMDGHAEACKKFSIQLLDGIPPPPIESSLERSYIYDRIALDAQLYKGDIKSLYASHCDTTSNATSKTNIRGDRLYDSDAQF
ncbi:hypothetical protein BDP27DRAFT_219734 [Rhodocollybia butyracea]|uniref:MYND-type domain-containing protein n=1 Tax=Rhodocollybia butyracea TaxID=206335 RepID=A0A9P5UCH2_9AGAR|nr:hypothetical protein BDP27DRAFT_219734 [Rhodocollybia butyracea]